MPAHVRRFFLIRVAVLLAIVLSLSSYGGFALFRTFTGATPSRLWILPIIFFVITFVWAMGMRRVGRPLGGIVEAAERVASGDFGVRVAEYGPPWLRSVATAFNSMTARLALQQKQRRDLMADVAHELRTPLTVMQGRLEGMLDGVYPRDEAHLAHVLEETRLLARLVDDLRTLAHSESGTLALEKESTDLTVLLDETVTAFRPEAEARAVAISARIPPELPLIDIDPLRIREVITNLLTNAVRYSPDGATVNVEAEAATDAITIRVRDNGPGISADDLPHVFDRFYKGARSGGSGLGLTIARNLMTAHGGTIAAESREGAGATLTITLPIASE
jgi:signal transduction histidine kinase